MARFYGSVVGSRGAAQRMGGAGSGIHTTAAGWAGCVKVDLFDQDGEDWCVVYLDSWRGSGEHKLLYRGPVSYKAADTRTRWHLDKPVIQKPVKKGPRK